MRYVSTRGAASPVSFEDAVRNGLAPDGGLYVPEEFPVFSATELKTLSHLSYIELARAVMQPFVTGSLSPGELAALSHDSYAHFAHEDVTPLVKLDDRLHLLELFHGPTLAFKDIALQFLGRVFGHFTAQKNQPLTIVGATSGDTGSAAIEGCRGIAGVRVFILYPHERPSDVQRRQMTCVDAPNIHTLAVKGSFDECQNLVKRLFNDPAARAHYNLTAVNSINWARIMAQVVYYFYAGLKAGALNTPVNFVVPTGNFGNIYAGYVAKQMGLPVAKLVIATNRNDSLVTFFNTGAMEPTESAPTLSPSMDIQIASNAERYVFEMLGRDGTALNALMQQKQYQLPEAMMRNMRDEFMAAAVSDAETEDTMRAIWQKNTMLIDPHTAVGVHVAQKLRGSLDGAIISLACAHPAKFPETVLKVTGQHAPLPPALHNLYQRKENFRIIAADYTSLLESIA
jgi:threonine synthase